MKQDSENDSKQNLSVCYDAGSENFDLGCHLHLSFAQTWQPNVNARKASTQIKRGTWEWVDEWRIWQWSCFSYRAQFSFGIFWFVFYFCLKVEHDAILSGMHFIP